MSALCVGKSRAVFAFLAAESVGPERTSESSIIIELKQGYALLADLKLSL